MALRIAARRQGCRSLGRLAAVGGALVLALPLVSVARPVPALRYTPPRDSEEERPVLTSVSGSRSGADYRLLLEFDREPAGEACKTRCANVTLFLDTDHDRSTGLQLGKDAAETGADLSISVQGVREYKEGGAESRLKVHLRHFVGRTPSPEESQPVVDLDSLREPNRLQLDGKSVRILIDIDGTPTPRGKKLRIIYHPPGASAVEGTAPGFGAIFKGPIQVVNGKHGAKHKTRETDAP